MFLVGTSADSGFHQLVTSESSLRNVTNGARSNLPASADLSQKKK